MSIGGKYIEEFAAFLGWEVDTKDLEKFDKSVKAAEDGVKAAGKAIAVAAGAVNFLAGALGGLIALTNKATAEKTNLAAAVGLSAENVDALSSVIESLGFDFEKTIDLVEELNNKIGEMKSTGEMSSVRDSIRMLGLEWKDLSSLSPEDQFIAVLDAAKNLEDQQRAVSAVDMLMGGDANRILGFLRTQDGSLREILERRKQLILLDKEGRAGAVLFNEIMIQARTVVGSLIAQFSGLAGKALAPVVVELIDFVVANKELIRTNVRKWVDSAVRGLRSFIETSRKIIEWIRKLVEAFGGLENLIKLLAIGFIALKTTGIIMWIGQLTLAIRAAGLAAALLNASIALIPFLIALAVAAVALIAEDLYQFFTGGESLFGRLLDKGKLFYDELLKVGEKWIDAAIEQWAEWLGVSKEDLVDTLIDMTDSLTAFFTELWDNFTRLPELAKEAFNLAWEAVSDWLDKIADVPLIRLLGGGPNREAPQTPTGGYRTIDDYTGRGGTTMNSSDNRMTVQNKINVTQLPGESGEAFASRVVGILEEKAAIANRNNSTGVAY